MALPIIGKGEEWPYHEFPDESGDKHKFQLTGVHFFTDLAAQFLADMLRAIVRDVVASELDARGLSRMDMIAKDVGRKT